MNTQYILTELLLTLATSPLWQETLEHYRYLQDSSDPIIYRQLKTVAQQWAKTYGPYILNRTTQQLPKRRKPTQKEKPPHTKGQLPQHPR